MLQIVYSVGRTPKARLVGSELEIELGRAILEPRLGPARHLTDGVGWNLNRRDFKRAEQRLLQRRLETAGRRAGSGELWRLLWWADGPAPSTFVFGGTPRTFRGYGRAFRASAKQAELEGRHLAAVDGRRCRYAYYD